MIGALRTWLLSIIAAGLVLAILYALVPKGRLRPIVRTTGGVALMLVILRPVLGFDFTDLAASYGDYAQEIQALTETYRAADAAELAAIIEQRTAAYISEKAAQLGLSCRPRVETAWRDGVPYPSGVTLDIAENQALAEVLTDELGIPPSQQHWLG